MLIAGRVRVENRSSVPVELTSCATGRIATSNALNMNVMVQAVGVGVGHETKYGVGQVFETKHTLVGTKPGVEPAHTHLSLVGWSHIHVTIRALDPHRPCLISSTDLASMNTFFLEEKDFAPDPAGGVTSATDPHIKSNADSGNLSKKEKRLRCIFWPCFMCCGD